MNLAERSYKKELLDGDNIPFADIKKNMQELNAINTLLGGHAITIKGFKKLLGDKKKKLLGDKKKVKVTVCEIGCGGGDNLAAIVKWCRKNKVEINCIGIDLKGECIEVAKGRTELTAISRWIASDYADVVFETKPDIIFSSLFCHHFTNEQLVRQLQWINENSVAGFFINDLHRHQLAYHSIRILTKLFSSSYLVKNDAPLSVARGFKKSEWIQLCQAAGLQNARVGWEWAFRHLVFNLKI